jgi:hypothetical protein
MRRSIAWRAGIAAAKKHLDVAAGRLEQDAREVATKRAKTFWSDATGQARNATTQLAAIRLGVARRLGEYLLAARGFEVFDLAFERLPIR